MPTTPRLVAEMIAAGAAATGATVTYSNATEQGRYGMMYIQMPDGEVISIKIELS